MVNEPASSDLQPAGEVFGGSYAGIYDQIYTTKDYDRECEVIVESLGIEPRPRGSRPVTILDIGCGTGNHALRLARQGFHVIGVDPAAHMLARAREKAEREDLDIRFIRARAQDLASCALPKVDAVILMSTILGYVASTNEILATLKAIRGLLDHGASVVGDFWYGPSVVRREPATTFVDSEEVGRRVLRVAQTSVDIERQVCLTTLTFWTVDNSQFQGIHREHHTIRFFFPEELRLLFDTTGFRLGPISSFPDVSQTPDSDRWPAFLRASAI